MAARGHVQDPNDRRLRPIYDYLDNGNNKMAIQQADKLLKKHKDLHCAKVLKAIGLQRTGKQDEAFTLAQEVATLEPTDDNSLQALTILYREMHRRDLVMQVWAGFYMTDFAFLNCGRYSENDTRALCLGHLRTR
uniref:Uncharacterized protein n=1 Tax=Scophthalmus maximus TaxID=52904 RepID=A0A8D3BM04_SCOMX